MKKVTGIGGIFFKSKDVAKLREWYRDNLGFQTTDWGASISWTDPKTNGRGRTEWSPFKESSDYFSPSELPYMINYRVDDLYALVDELKKNGISTVGDVSDTEYGKFAWIVDPEGRKVELYQPAESEDYPEPWTGKVLGLSGVYLRSADPVKTKEWYKKHLDVDSNLPPLKRWDLIGSNDKIFSGTDKPYVFEYTTSSEEEVVNDPDGNKIILSRSK